jgi:ABC-type glutathione transport system ATPase component
MAPMPPTRGEPALLSILPGQSPSSGTVNSSARSPTNVYKHDILKLTLELAHLRFVPSGRGAFRYRASMLALPSAEAPALSLLSVSKRFGATQALEDVDHAVCDREVAALMGANGDGKSTLAKIAAGGPRGQRPYPGLWP